MPAIKYTKTAVDTDTAWDSSKALAAIPSEAKADTLRKEFAWSDPDKDQDTKGAYKFPHHFVDEKGNISAASSKACSAGIAVLNGGRGGAKIPDEDRKAVYNHLAAHLKDASLEAPALNSLISEVKHKETFQIEKNSFEVNDETGTITFPMGQCVMDGTQLRSGARYDMPSLDVSEFNGSVTADHVDMIQSIVAKTSLVKRGQELLMNAIQFAVKENPLAQIAYDLYKGGYAHDYSIETMGPPANESGLFMNAKVVGLSCVVTGNSRSATMSAAITNSLATARSNGLDTTDAEKVMGVEHVEEDHQHNNNHKKVQDMKYITYKNNRDFAVTLKYKNAAEEEIESELAAGASFDASEDQKEAIEKQINDAKDPSATSMTPDVFEKALNKALDERDKKLDERLEKLQQDFLDANAVEPAFHTGGNGTSARNMLTANKLEDMGWEERTVKQLQSLHAMLKGDPEASRFVWAANQFNLEALQKSDKKYNALSLTDLGNFVIPPEMVTKIFGHVSNFQPLLSKFTFQETLSLITSYITRTGETDMQDVDMDSGAPGANGLKPISQPQYTTKTAALREFASITPVDASAIRFSAADIMQDIAAQYRRAYDRALARSVIGRIEQAVQSNGQSQPFNVTTGNGGDIGALSAMLDIWTPIVEWVPDGVFLMTQATVLQLMKHALKAGPNGPFADIFTRGDNGQQLFFNLPYVTVPSAVMPTLNNMTGPKPTFTFEGQTVTVQHSILLANPDNFMGRVSGGLQFDVSTEAAYEESGTVKSAYQRDKLVFRGYGYRKSALTLPSDVAGVNSDVVS